MWMGGTMVKHAIKHASKLLQYLFHIQRRLGDHLIFKQLNS